MKDRSPSRWYTIVMALTRASTTREPAQIAMSTPRIPSVVWPRPKTLSSSGSRRSSMASGVSTSSARSRTSARNCSTASIPSSPWKREMPATRPMISHGRAKTAQNEASAASPV